MLALGPVAVGEVDQIANEPKQPAIWKAIKRIAVRKLVTNFRERRLPFSGQHIDDRTAASLDYRYLVVRKRIVLRDIAEKPMEIDFSLLVADLVAVAVG